jgi:hypothetical protein
MKDQTILLGISAYNIFSWQIGKSAVQNTFGNDNHRGHFYVPILRRSNSLFKEQLDKCLTTFTGKLFKPFAQVFFGFPPILVATKTG